MLTINGKEFVRLTYQDHEGIDNIISLPVDYTGRDVIRALKQAGAIKRNCRHASLIIRDKLRTHNYLHVCKRERGKIISLVILLGVRD